MLMQALVRTLDQHELMTNSIPILKLSYRTCLHVAGLQEHATAPSRYEWLKYWIWETLVITMTCGQILEFKVCKQLYWCEYSYGTKRSPMSPKQGVRRSPYQGPTGVRIRQEESSKILVLITYWLKKGLAMTGFEPASLWQDLNLQSPETSLVPDPLGHTVLYQ